MANLETDPPMVADTHDQDSCTPDPSTASLNPFPSAEFLDDNVGANGPSGSQNATSNEPAESPGNVAQGISSGAELLSRLSLANASHPKASLTHPEDHSDLDLSGRIISATFSIPYKLGFRPGEQWVRA